MVCGLLIGVAFLVVQRELKGAQVLVAMAHGLSSSGSSALDCEPSSCGAQA